MTLSWTCCDVCFRRVDVLLTDLGYLCRICRQEMDLDD